MLIISLFYKLKKKKERENIGTAKFFKYSVFFAFLACIAKAIPNEIMKSGRFEQKFSYILLYERIGSMQTIYEIVQVIFNVDNRSKHFSYKSFIELKTIHSNINTFICALKLPRSTPRGSASQKYTDTFPKIPD